MQPSMSMPPGNQNAIRQDSDLERILEIYNKNAPKKQKTGQSLSLPFYKGVQLPSHLKWLTITSKTTENMLMEEIMALEKEIGRLKELKAFNREYRKLAGFPIGVLSKPCPCCRKWERKFHMCTHIHCPKPCKKMDLFLYRLRKRAKRKLNALGINDKTPLTQDIVEFQLKHIMDDLEQVMNNPESL